MESYVSFLVLGLLVLVVAVIISDALGIFYNMVIRKLLKKLL